MLASAGGRRAGCERRISNPRRGELNLRTTSVPLVGCNGLLATADVSKQLGELRSSLEEIRLQRLGSFKR